MSLSAIAAVKALLLPPTLNFIFIVVGLLLLRRAKTPAYLLMLVGVFSLLLLCLEPVSYQLSRWLESHPALPVPVLLNNEQAIVVLGAGINTSTPEFGRSIDTAKQLQRLHYAGLLHQQTALPVLVSGGYVHSQVLSEAAVMAQTLQNSFRVDTVWQEQQSENTAENALYSVELLNAQEVEKVFLVTHARHMPRAVMMFEAQGMAVTPAPTGFTEAPDYRLPATYLPSVYALAISYAALHEYLGIAWYRWRY